MDTSGGKLGRSETLSTALERRDELHETLVRLEKALAAPASAVSWRKRLRDQLQDLQRVFEVHVEITEAEDGLYAEILPAAPRLAHMMDVLRREHHEIREALDHALHAIEAPEGAGEPEALREELLGLLGHLVRHRQKGADLLYEAYDVDLGGQE